MYIYLYIGLFVLIEGASTSYIPYREIDHFITIPSQVDSPSSSSSLTSSAAHGAEEDEQNQIIQGNKVEIQLHSASNINSMDNIQNDVNGNININGEGYDDDDNQDYGEREHRKFNSVQLPPQLGVYFQHLPQHQQQLYRDYYLQQKQQQQKEHPKKPQPFTYNYKHANVLEGGHLRKRYPTHLDPFMQAKMWFRSGECPVAPDGARQFFCPTPTVDGVWNCVDDHELCDGVKTCPNAEDENTLVCMFYKAMQSQINYVANGISQAQSMKTDSEEDD